jgi:hypothetical protein
MKRVITSLLTCLSLLVFNIQAQSLPIKLSKSGICHAPGTRYYEQTKSFKPFNTMKECLTAGGRLPK